MNSFHKFLWAPQPDTISTYSLPATSHSTWNHCWRSWSDEAKRSTLSANVTSIPIKQTPFQSWLGLDILSVKMISRSRDKKHMSQKQTGTLNSFDFVPGMQPKLLQHSYRAWIAFGSYTAEALCLGTVQALEWCCCWGGHATIPGLSFPGKLRSRNTLSGPLFQNSKKCPCLSLPAYQ